MSTKTLSLVFVLLMSISTNALTMQEKLYNDLYDNIRVPRLHDASSLNNPIECLAMNIYHEARGEAIDGQRGVAHVTKNRVNDWRYDNNYCDVVFKKGWSKKYKKWVAQFSWTLDGKSDMVFDDKSYKDAYIIAIEIVYGLYDNDLTSGSTHYHKYTVNPDWMHDPKMIETIRLGQHIFYMWYDSRKNK